MAKFSGKIGFAVQSEIRPGVWTESITERHYYGNITRNARRLQSSGGVNDDIEISNRLSIIADPFAYENFHAIRYVIFMGSKWKITEVEVEYPRLLLSLGGVWNGPTA